MNSVGIETIRVFYSWQSDLPDKFNRSAIRDSLRYAKSSLEGKEPFASKSIEIDEATREVPGSPNIPLTILDKIQKSDIFVADITLVNQGVDTDPKKTPNPNVLFELGFAVSQLGWSRVVLLFNKAHGVTAALPFDIDRQRVSIFCLSDQVSSVNELRELCVAAIKLIIKKNPSRPSVQFDVATAKHTRDIRQLTELLEYLHWPIIEKHLDDAPKRISKDILGMYEYFVGVRTTATFHIYDTQLLNLVDTFAGHWHETTKFGHRYDPSPYSDYYTFTYSHDSHTRKIEEADMSHIRQELANLHVAMRELIGYLRQSYIELDLESLSSDAWERLQVSELE